MTDKENNAVEKMGVTDLLKALITKTHNNMLSELRAPIDYTYNRSRSRNMYTKYDKLHSALISAAEEYCD